jgi:hypothetical protein
MINDYSLKLKIIFYLFLISKWLIIILSALTNSGEEIQLK